MSFCNIQFLNLQEIWRHKEKGGPVLSSPDGDPGKMVRGSASASVKWYALRVSAAGVLFENRVSIAS
jgi:hypothetical protein